MLRDIESLGWNAVTSMSDDLRRLSFTLEDTSKRSHDVIITLPETYPDGIPQCQLALPDKVDFQWKKSNSLHAILNELRAVLDRYDAVWSVLEDMDRHCVVIDPTKPTFEHNYRRIYLRKGTGGDEWVENQCSLMYTVNLERPFAMGELLLVGPTAQKEELERQMNAHIRDWCDCRSGVSARRMDVVPRINIETLLQISLPEPSETSISQYEIECAICYSCRFARLFTRRYKLEDHGKTFLPDKSCPNEKCGRVFHYTCLLDMMRSNPTTKQSFNTLYGYCPYCQTPISIATNEGFVCRVCLTE